MFGDGRGASGARAEWWDKGHFPPPAAAAIAVAGLAFGSADDSLSSQAFFHLNNSILWDWIRYSDIWIYGYGYNVNPNSSPLCETVAVSQKMQLQFSLPAV